MKDYEALGMYGILVGICGFIFIGLGVWKGFFIPLGIITWGISMYILFYVISHKDF